MKQSIIIAASFWVQPMTIATAEIVMAGSALAQSDNTALAAQATSKAGVNNSFSTLRRIKAGVLSAGYAEVGPADGAPVVLLHGWPYDIYSFVDVAPLLAASGCRVIVPYLRGYGTTRFVSRDAFPNLRRLQSTSLH
jgi:hypothetical protein